MGPPAGERYGNWRGVHNRLRMWAVDGAGEGVFTALMAQADANEDLNWAVSVECPRSCARTSTRPGPAKGAPAGELVVGRGRCDH